MIIINLYRLWQQIQFKSKIHPNHSRMSNLPKSTQQNETNHEQQQKTSNQDKSNNYSQNYDQNQMDDYFKSINGSSLSKQKSDFYTYQRYINVTQNIYNGLVQINDISINIDDLLAKQKINDQQQKTQELKAKKTAILRQLSMLDQQLSKSKHKNVQSKDRINFSMDASRITSKSKQQDDKSIDKINKKFILSKDQHKQLIRKIVKQRSQRQKNRILFKQKQQEKLKKLQEQQRKAQIKRIEDERKRKAEEIEQKLKKKKQAHQKFLQQQKQSLKKVHQVKNKKFLYQEIEQKFQMKVKMPMLQEQKKILKEKRQFAKAYSIDQIKNHQKTYLSLRQSSMMKSQAKQSQNSRTEAYKAPKKSTRLQRILEQEKLEQRKKLMQKKRAIQEKLQRQQNYVEYLKQNFSKVKIDKQKQQEIKSRIEKNKIKKQQIDHKSIGINYLQEAKRLRKKTPQNPNLSQKEEALTEQHQGNITVLSEQIGNKKVTSQSRISDMRRNNLIKKRQQNIQILINNQKMDETERIRKLKMQTERINEAFRMKQEMLKYGYNQKVQEEAVQLLLASIQAKMGIIDISKQKPAIKN